MQDPDLARYKILQGLLFESLEAKDPVAQCLELGVSEADLALLRRLAQDRALLGGVGIQKWLPGLARELIEELEGAE